MLDHHSSSENRPDVGREKSRDPAASPSRPTADREVPLARHRSRRTPTSVHAWLDGDLPEAAVRRADTVRDVEFWHRIEKDVDQRRQMRTPPHVYSQIMNALPQTTPRVITPWWRRQFVMTPAVVLAGAAGLVAVGLALGMAVLRMR